MLNARILWIFSRAYHLFGEEEYKALADRAQHYFIRHFIDKEMGYMNYERVEGNLIRKIDWWPQAESVVAFYNAWQITQDEKYLTAALQTWSFVKENLIDDEHGGWYSGLDADNRPATGRPKADLWKCPYHNSRMGFELMVRSQQTQENKQLE